MVELDRYGFFDKIMSLDQTNWANYWHGVIPDCVVAGIGDEFLVKGMAEGMKVRVYPGEAIVNNHRAWNEEWKYLPISAADEEFPRIDTVVLRVIYGDVVSGVGTSKIVLDVLDGTPDPDPVPAELTKETGNVYEIPLAYVKVAVNVVTIQAEDVADARSIFEPTGTWGDNYKNGGEEKLEKGQVVQFVNGNAEAVKAWTTFGTAIGVCTNDGLPGETVKVQTKPGYIAEVKCDSGIVRSGDALSIAEGGLCYRGGDPNPVIGIALETKEKDIIRNVKTLLTIFPKIPVQNVWYLPDGINESDVIAAYCFRGVRTQDTALYPVNQVPVDKDYKLTPLACTWTDSKGFLIKAQDESGLTNSALLTTDLADCQTAVFRYDDLSHDTNTIAGGVAVKGNLSADKNFGLFSLKIDNKQNSRLPYLRGAMAYIDTTHNQSGDAWWMAKDSAVPKAVFGIDFPDTGEPNIYRNGSIQTVTTLSGDFRYLNWTVPRVKQEDRETENKILIGNARQKTGTQWASVWTGWTVQACVFYKSQLTADQHMEIYSIMQGL